MYLLHPFDNRQPFYWRKLILNPVNFTALGCSEATQYHQPYPSKETNKPIWPIEAFLFISQTAL